ncbi:hypothetical protein BCR43DRAFT_74634 [Syncephalastrum racemosum]|uniref:Uncharacterized protein n=1 Tax=Syncephalastrum racemosum TaxID=13706 RepID=A0A1X2H295_SYNRA|nr:hypothetical protein BCR43DRAFT_74634 [Syncephalastrum racemosum]
MMDVFRHPKLSAVCDRVLLDFMHADAVSCKFNNDELIQVISIVDALENKTKSIREAKRDLLTLSSDMSGAKTDVTEDLAIP